MSEENQLQNSEKENQVSAEAAAENGSAPKAETSEEISTAEKPATTEAATKKSVEQPAEEKTAGSPDEQKTKPTPTKPQVIIQKERGFSHYVGFSLLCVLCILFFFLPGIFITFGVSRIVDLNSAAAWVFGALLSFIVWLIFKLKIKGFKKSFYFYIGFCTLIFIILLAIQIGADYNIFSELVSLLFGAKS